MRLIEQSVVRCETKRWPPVRGRRIRVRTFPPAHATPFSPLALAGPSSLSIIFKAKFHERRARLIVRRRERGSEPNGGEKAGEKNGKRGPRWEGRKKERKKGRKKEGKKQKEKKEGKENSRLKSECRPKAPPPSSKGDEEREEGEGGGQVDSFTRPPRFSLPPRAGSGGSNGNRWAPLFPST